MNNITYTEKALQLLSEHAGYEGSLFYALRDLVDEYESTRFYRNREPVKISDVNDRHRDPVSYEEGSWTYYPTTYRLFDLITGGLRQGWLYMVTGKAGSGKTRLLFNLALQVSSFRRTKALYFSLKTDTVGIARRIYTSIAARHQHEAGHYNPEDDFYGIGMLEHPNADDYNLHLQGLNSRSLGALVDQIAHCARELEFKVFFIDDPEELFAGSPPHVMAYRRRWLYEQLSEVCQFHGVCIVMARRSEATDFERGIYGNGLYDLEQRGYHLENVDVVLHAGSATDRPWFDPIRQIKILKYPRPLKHHRFYLYQDERQELVRNARASDFPREPREDLYLDLDGFYTEYGFEQPTDEEGKQVPF
jgi:hypothetical protein